MLNLHFLLSSCKHLCLINDELTVHTWIPAIIFPYPFCLICSIGGEVLLQKIYFFKLLFVTSFYLFNKLDCPRETFYYFFNIYKRYGWIFSITWNCPAIVARSNEVVH